MLLLPRMTISYGNHASLMLHLSGWKIFPATLNKRSTLNKCSTSVGDAGIAKYVQASLLSTGNRSRLSFQNDASCLASSASAGCERLSFTSVMVASGDVVFMC